MTMTHTIDIDLLNPGTPRRIQVKQGEVYTRKVALALFRSGDRWCLPEDASAVIRYHAHGLDCGSDTRGIYDTLPNGSPAWEAHESVVIITLSPQMLTAHSIIQTDVIFVREQEVLATCNFEIYVNPAPVDGKTPLPEGYYNVASLSQINEKFAAIDAMLEAHAAHVAAPCVRTINGAAPDEDGNIAMEGGNILVTVDSTLSKSGQAADAKAVGTAVGKKSNTLALELGVELDTGDTWMGKPIYTKVIDRGTAENGKIVTYGLTGQTILRGQGIIGPFVSPRIHLTTDNEHSCWMEFWNQQLYISCGSTIQSAAYQAYAQIWYTKN